LNKIYLLILFTSLSGCLNNDKSPEASSKNYIATQQPALKESIRRGEMVYADFCLQCHMAGGEGVAGSFPPLAGSNWLVEKRSESIQAVKYGQKGPIVVNGESYNSVMVPMGLSDSEIADVLNYVMNSWGNTQKSMVTKEEVAAISE
jgi:mono/diheme cytochrome c family protein